VRRQPVNRASLLGVVDDGLASEAAINPRVVRKRTAIVEKWCE